MVASSLSTTKQKLEQLTECAAGEIFEDTVILIQGVVLGIRSQSASLSFVDVRCDDGDESEGATMMALQVCLVAKHLGKEQHEAAMRRIATGDRIAVTGIPGKTRTGSSGDMTLFAKHVDLQRVTGDPGRLLVR